MVVIALAYNLNTLVFREVRMCNPGKHPIRPECLLSSCMHDPTAEVLFLFRLLWRAGHVPHPYWETRNKYVHIYMLATTSKKQKKKKRKRMEGKNAIGAGLLYPEKKNGEHMRIDSNKQTILTFDAAASAAVVIEVGRRMEAFWN